MQEEDLDSLVNEFKEKTGKTPIVISAAAKKNTDVLLNGLFELLDKVPKEEYEEEEEYFDPSATDHKFDEFEVYKDELGFCIEGRKIAAQIQVTNLEDFESTAYLMRMLKGLGVFDELKKKGAKEGDTVFSCGFKFEFNDDTLILV